jgi:peptidoglycan hydrolase-like protein with peptidoglycan-binding domain
VVEFAIVATLNEGKRLMAPLARLRSRATVGRAALSLVFAAVLGFAAPVEPARAGGGDFLGGVAVGVIGTTIIHGLTNQKSGSGGSPTTTRRVRERAPEESIETRAIRQDQSDLATLGYFGAAQDGRKSPAFEAAVVQYKLSKGLIGTSILSETERALLRAEAVQRQVLIAIGDPAADPLVVPGGERRAQVALKELALYDGAIDGKKGKKLTAAISRWQASAGQAPTGVLSSDQTRLLMSTVAGQAQSRLAAIDQQFASMAQAARPVPSQPAAMPLVTAAPAVAPQPVAAVAVPVQPAVAVAAPVQPAKSSFAAIEPVNPQAKSIRPHDVAVVIGNQAYQNGIPEVSYGLRDAEAMRSSLVNHLGFSPDNVIMVENATQGDMATVFGNRESFKGKIWKYIDPDGRSKVFVFYSGHGMPDVQSKSPFILPVDANPATVTINGYPLELVYSNLEKLNIEKAYVFLDACFSGGSNTRMLIQSASPIYVSAKVDTGARSDKLTILAASEGDQLASWDDREGHGLFTSYVLKGLAGEATAGGDGRLTAAKLHAYVLENVRKQARRIYGREQTPVLIGDAEAEIARR